MRLLAFPNLETEKGIPYSRQHLWRLIKAKRFPAPVRLGTNTNRWVESEIDDWLRQKIEQRESHEAA
jgi:prophage regulatory protein